MTIATISLHDIETSEHGNVWVLNRTSGTDKGPVNFTVPKSNGTGMDTVIVPLTFLPIDLTEQVTKKQILDSSEFRRALRLGFISLVDNDSAQAMMTISGAEEERLRLRSEMLNMEVGAQVSSTNPEEIQPNNAAMSAVDMRERAGAVSESAAVSSENRIDNLLPTVVVLMEELADKEEVHVINSLRTLRSELTQDDLSYIQDKARSANYRKLAKWCINAGSKRTA